MEILLKRSLDKVGNIGDVVNVRPGFARNYLLPRGFAVLVTKANLAHLEKERARALIEEQARVSGLKEVAERLAQTSVTIEGRANAEGHLFGSVTTAQISRALHDKGFHIDERAVRLESPLKEIGVFDVALHLHQDVDATIKVWVVPMKPS